MGAHQHSNIAAAVTAAWVLRDTLGITWEHVRAGLASAYLAGRMQVRSSGEISGLSC